LTVIIIKLTKQKTELSPTNNYKNVIC